MGQFPVIRFDGGGRISNCEEIFAGVSFSAPDLFGEGRRSVLAWLNEPDKVVQGMGEPFFFWGEVLVGQGRTSEPNLSGTHLYYRICPTGNSKKERACRNCAAGAVEK